MHSLYTNGSHDECCTQAYCNAEAPSGEGEFCNKKLQLKKKKLVEILNANTRFRKSGISIFSISGLIIDWRNLYESTFTNIRSLKYNSVYLAYECK